jgi:hypothetical protein
MNQSLMNTSQRIQHVFGCSGAPVHVHPGFAVLRTKTGNTCPTCGKPVTDITDTPLGQSYFAFARPDLGVKKQ